MILKVNTDINILFVITLSENGYYDILSCPKLRKEKEMTKKLGIITSSVVTFYDIKKTLKPIVDINNRIYRIDDKLFMTQTDAANSYLLYEVESTQPKGNGEFLDPDQTKMYIDSMKCGKKKPSKMTDGMSISKFLPVIVLIAIVMSVAYALSR